MIETPFKLTEAEIICSAAATLCLEGLATGGIRLRRLDDTTENPQYGYAASATEQPTPIRYLRITDIKAGSVDWASVPFCQCEQPKSYLLSAGDLLIARSGSVGKSFFVTGSPEPAVFASYMIRIRTKSGLLPEFAFWCFQSQQFWEQLMSQRRGSAMANINGPMLSGLKFPIPDETVQKRIVDFLNNFRHRIQGRRVSLGELPRPIKDIPRSVARIEEIASHIQEARTLRHQAADEAGVLLTAARRTVLSECRAKTVALEDACAAIIDNLHSNPRLSDTGVPCIRSPDVGYGTLNIEGAHRTDEDEFRRRIVRGEPRADDIVLVREGGGTGKCALVQKGQRFSLGQRVMMLRPNTEHILPQFFLHQLLSPQVQEQQIAPLSKGSASPHLNIGALRRFNLILPPLPEQHRIVAELDALQAEVDALKRLQAETAAELDALLPAILDRAFRGEL